MKFIQNIDWKNQEGIAYLKNPDVDGKTISNWTYEYNKITWTAFI
jgi:hypothetical protein